MSSASPEPDPPERSNTRITVGEHFADLLINRQGPRAIYYWIVQRLGSADVVAWGQEETFDKAEESARHHLGQLEQFKKRGPITA